jgi:hypothetical protein
VPPTTAVAEAYAPGVRSGDWAQYDVIILGDRTLFRGTLRFASFLNVQYSKVNVTTVTGNMVALTETIHFLNGTDYLFTTFKVDVNSTEPNFLIAAGLNSPDALTPGSTYRINSTETRTILGISRSINYLNEYNNESGLYSSEAWAWDKASGFLVAVALTLSQSGKSETITMTISKTNLWVTPTIFGLNPTLFYGLTAIGSIVVSFTIGITASKFLRSRRHATVNSMILSTLEGMR